MGRFSNIILVNGSGKILDSSVHVDFDVSKLREVMPARVYSYPPAQNKLSAEEALEMVRNGELPIIEDESPVPSESHHKLDQRHVSRSFKAVLPSV